MSKEILFHAGLPKTGTTSIQRTLYASREQLAAAGVYYPEPDTPDDPKHQFLVTGLLSGNQDGLVAAIKNSPNDGAVFFSAEGLSNHLFDFDEASARSFRKVLAPYRCSAVLVTRPWGDWVKSYFKQCIVNPPHERWTHYAFSGSLEDFERHDRVRRFSSPNNLAEGLASRLGIDAVDIIPYSPTVLDDVISWLPPEIPLDRLSPPPVEMNMSLSDVGAEVARQINGLIRDRAERARWIRLIAETDGASNTIARSAGRTRAGQLLPPAHQLPTGLEWNPECGLDVSHSTFERFLAELEKSVRDEVG